MKLTVNGVEYEKRDGFWRVDSQAVHWDEAELLDEIAALREKIDAILNIVSPENDPPDEDLTPEGVVESVRELKRYADETTAALAREREACDEWCAVVGSSWMNGSRPMVNWEAFTSLCKVHHQRRAAEAKEAKP